MKRDKQASLWVCLGLGGVGKTSVAAALGLAAAEAGLRTLVITIDPARRLLQAMGIEHEVALGVAHKIENKNYNLSIMMLDAQEALDSMVKHYANTPELAQSILEHPVYAHLCGHLVGMHELAAVEKLYDVLHADLYDRIILDTPPAQNALDFFTAPMRIADFLGEDSITSFFRPLRSAQRGTKLLQWGFHWLEQILGQVAGTQTLSWMADFLHTMESLSDGIKQRSSWIEHCLKSEQTHLLAIASCDHRQSNTLKRTQAKMMEMGLKIKSLVINHCPVQTGINPAAFLQLRKVRIAEDMVSQKKWEEFVDCLERHWRHQSEELERLLAMQEDFHSVTKIPKMYENTLKQKNLIALMQGYLGDFSQPAKD